MDLGLDIPSNIGSWIHVGSLWNNVFLNSLLTQGPCVAIWMFDKLRIRMNQEHFTKLLE